MFFFYLGFLLIWFVVLWLVVKGIMRGMESRHKSVITTAIIAVAFPLPLADEIVGAIQFSALCKSQVLYKAPDMAERKGTNLIFIAHEKVEIKGAALPMTREVWEYVGESDRSLLFRYAVIKADQGFLARTVRLNDGGNPLIFTGVCYPKERKAIFSEYNIIN